MFRFREGRGKRKDEPWVLTADLVFHKKRHILMQVAVEMRVFIFILEEL
jgi:hypothetical protein